MTTTQAQIYLYLNSVWTDVTSDVLSAGRISGEYGMRDDRARIADIGSLSFSLRNTTKKYSPNSGSALSGWKKGTPVRLDITLENNYTVTKFKGAIDSIEIEGGTQRGRTVRVRALDWLDYAAKYPINSPAIEQNKTTDEAITTIVNAMPIQPTTTTLAAGVSVYPTIFDTATTKTKAYTEFTKLVNSEPGYLYIKSNDELVFEAADTRNGLDTLKQVPVDAAEDFLLLETGDLLLLEDGGGLILNDEALTDVVIDNTMTAAEIEYGRNMVNRFTSSAYPKRIATTQSKLYELENPLYFASAQSRSFEIQYTDPTSKRLVAALTPSDTGYIKSLLHFDTGGKTTITDEVGKVWTANDVELVTNIVKFGDAALYFDGSDSYATTPSSSDFEFGSGDFSIDWWEWRFNTTSGATTTMRDYSASFPAFSLGQSDGTNLKIYMSSNGSSFDIANGKTLGAITTNTWNHFEVTRRGNNFYAFKNGVLTDSWTSSASLVASTAVMSLGRNGSTYLTAVLDEFKVSKGSAGHTAGFTPETQAYTLSGVVYSAYTNEDSTGTELTGDFTVTATFGSVGAVLTVTNNSTDSGYINTLKIYSYVVQSDTPITDIQESTASINEYGYQNDSLDMQYQQDIDAGALEGQKVVELEKTPRTNLRRISLVANKNELQAQAFFRVDIGDLVSVQEDQSGVDAWYYVQGVEYEITSDAFGGVNIMYSWILKRAFLLAAGLTLMACDFNDGVSTDAVDFGVIPVINNLTTKSMSAWVYIDASADAGVVAQFDGVAVGIGQVSKYAFLQQYYSTTFGGWTTANNTITIGAWHHIVWTQSGTSDPIIYIDGVSMAITETSTPAGDIVYDNNYLRSGNSYLMVNPLHGKIKDLRIYNRILSAAEADAIFDEGAGGTGNTSGMVFQAFAVRTDEVTAYTDLTLTAETKLLDAYLGTVGTPTGSPISRTI